MNAVHRVELKGFRGEESVNSEYAQITAAVTNPITARAILNRRLLRLTVETSMSTLLLTECRSGLADDRVRKRVGEESCRSSYPRTDRQHPRVFQDAQASCRISILQVRLFDASTFAFHKPHVGSCRGALQRILVIALQLREFSIFTKIFRSRGPSNSQKKIPCHRPNSNFPSSTKITWLAPTITALTCESVFPSLCR
jgi:hypothetical protein